MNKLGGCNEGWAPSVLESCLVPEEKLFLLAMPDLLSDCCEIWTTWCWRTDGSHKLQYHMEWNGTNFLSRLLNKGRYIVTCQRSHRSSHTMPHRIFWWCGGKRARWEKEVVALQNNSHRLKFRSMRLLSTIARVVVAMQFKIFSYFIHKSSDVL